MKTNPSLTLKASSLALISGIALSPTAHAVDDLFWDGGTTDIVSDGDGASAGGSGTWDNTILNWDEGTSPHVAWPVAQNSNRAYFGGTGGTVTLGADMGGSGSYPNSVFVTAGNYVLDLGGFNLSQRGSGVTISSGAQLVIQNGTVELLSNGNNFNVTGTDALTIDAIISNQQLPTPTTTGVNKGGAGDVRLTNELNDFTGPLQGSNGGNLYFSSIANIGIPSAAGAGDTVRNQANSSLNYTGSGDSTDRTLEVFGGGGDFLFNNGTGALIWTGPFVNNKTVASTFFVGGGGTGGTAANEFQGDLVDGAGVLSVTRNGASNWTLSGNNTYTGLTNSANSGNLVAGSSTAFGINSRLQLNNNGRVVLNGFDIAFGSLTTTVALTASNIQNVSGTAATLTTGGDNTDATFAASIQDGAGGGALSLTKVGTGKQSLTASTSYTGTTTVNGGTLSLGDGTTNTNLDDSSTVVVSGGMLELNYAGSDTIGALTFGVVPQLPGTYNAGNSPGFITGAGSIVVSGSYTTWAIDNGIPGEPANGDFEKDGISNLVEYALGTDPTVSTTPAGVYSSNTITYTKGSDAITNGDVSWVIETSETLASGSWTAQVTQPAGDATATIAYTLTPGSPVREFARLKVTQN